MSYFLSEDDPDLYERVKDHILDMPDGWQGEYPIACVKCGKRAIQKMNLLWICPELAGVPDKYLGAG